MSYSPRAVKSEPTTCPHEAELNGFIARTLGAGAAAKLEAHIAECDDCRNLVFALASSSSELAQGAPPVARIGKFAVEAVIGRGAMGTVYKARDPELDRVVAIKVRHSAGKLDVDGEDRVRREAQALARLTHPNVVAIYEAGRHDDSTYLAMEFVEGAPLDEWLATRRAREDIVARMAEAGRGLAAAHAAGLVHRDFKPRNVLVSTAGVAKVGDFGLVRVGDEDASSGSRSAAGVTSMTLTLSGALLGTPAYMSPEQLRGDVATDASDQFSFCVTLYEALYGHRPLEGTTVEKLLGSMTRPFSLPALPRLPSHVARVLVTGLALDPARRFASMTELLDVLDPRVGRRRRGVLLGSVAIGALVLGGVTYAAMRPDNARTELCGGAEDKLAGIWDGARKEQIQRAFAATKVTYASDAFKGLEQVLDRFTSDWVSMHRSACKATRVTGEQTEQLMSLRMWCLDGRLREAKAFTDALLAATPRMVTRAVDAASHLPDVDACADARALSDQVPPRDAAARGRIDALRDELAKAKTAAEFGKLSDGVAMLESVADRVKSEDYAPLEADALLELARKKFAKTGDPKVAEDLMKQAMLAAERGHADIVRVRAYIVLIFLIGNVQGRSEEAHQLAEHAAAVIKRLANPDGLEGQLLGNLGQLYIQEGKLDEAEKMLNRSVELLERAAGKDHIETARAVSMVADIARRRGDHQRSLELSRRAYEIHAKAYGEGHPETAKTRFGIGVALEDMGKIDEALVEVGAVLATLETALGPDHVDLAPASDELGILYRRKGKLKDAEAQHRRSLALREKGLGPEHPDTTLSLDNLALVLALQGRFDEALPLQKRSLASLEATYGADHPEVVASRSVLANIYLEAKRYKDALREFEHVVKDAERVLGPDHHDLSFYLSGMGKTLIELGRARDAVRAFERSLKLRGDQANPNDTAEVRFFLARALWDAKQDRSRAITLAESAREAYRSLDMTDVEDWLKTHKL